MTRKPIHRFAAILSLTFVSISSAPLFADASAEVQALFEKTYGQAVRGVKATRSSADDAKLAIVLLDAANAQSDNLPYRIYLLEQAYEFGKLHTDGMPTACDALQELSRAVPRRQLEAQEKLLSLYEIAFRNAAGKPNKDVHKKTGNATTDLIIEIAEAKKKRAEYSSAVMLLNKGTGIARAVAYTDRQDDIKSLLQEMTPLVPIDTKVQSARRALTRNPQDKDAARVLTDLYLRDLDRPVSALTYAPLIHDAPTLELFRLAGQPVGDLAADQALSLARWYAQLSTEGSAVAKTNTLIRAKVYFERVLSLKPSDGDAKAGLLAADLALVGLKVDGTKAKELAKSRVDRLGASVAIKPPQDQPKPEPKKPPTPAKPKPDPVVPVVPQPQPEPEMVEPEPKEVEPEFREEVLPDSYWKNRKSIFEF